MTDQQPPSSPRWPDAGSSELRPDQLAGGP
jgi:hypothetical protein